MRILTKRKKFLIILSLIFGFSIFFSIKSHYYQENSSEYLESDIKQKLKKAGYWELSPFIIDDNGGGDYNWSEASNQPWCKGSGTWSNPYIIENISINGLYSGIPLEIRDSRVFFIIKNSTFYQSGNFDMGIELDNVTNGLLVNNNLTNNYVGIFLYYSDNITISYNKLEENGMGISIAQSNNNSIYNNRVNLSLYYGIDLDGYNNNNTIWNNTIENSAYGIHLRIDSNNNKILENLLNSNIFGIYLDRANNNSVLDNILSKNDYGIRLGYSNYNIISNNTLISNVIPILEENCLGNIISMNIIDTDGDGLSDDDETNIYFTDSNNPDTDSDGMPDGWEVSNSLNPLIDDSSGDLDSDNL
ncbi:hypothetical protein LCGC14_2758090, partial [marine sediment metagenome]